MVAQSREKPQSLMPGFIADLADFLHAKRGRISSLARYLGTHQQHVSAWAANKQEPSGENVLQIMQWLEVERGQGRTEPERGPMTRKPGQIAFPIIASES